MNSGYGFNYIVRLVHGSAETRLRNSQEERTHVHK